MRPEPLPESGKHVGIDTGERRASQEQLGNTRHPDPRLDPEAEQAGVAEFRQPESAGGLLREHAAAGAGVQQKPPRRPRAEKDRDAGPPVGEEAERHDAHTGTPRDAALVGEPGLAPAKIDRDAERGKERHAENGKGFHAQDICQEARDLGLAYPIGQARKKAKETLRLDPDRAIQDLLGAINYLAAAVIVIEERKEAT